MKKISAFMLAIGLVVFSFTASAEVQTFQYDGAVWHGQLVDGMPQGFGTTDYDDGAVQIATMQDGKLTGHFAEMPYRIEDASDVKEDFYLAVGQFSDNKLDGPLYYYLSTGEWQETIFEQEVPISRV